MTPLGTAIFTFGSPWMFAMACAAAVALAAIVLFGRPALPRLSLILGAVGVVLLCLAAGLLNWQRPVKTPVNVMVDLSASTRSAEYRDPAKLRKRIEQLLGSAAHRITFFAETKGADPLSTAGNPSSTARLADLPGDRTVFNPPLDGNVLLFSDCRFDLSAALPPCFVVMDVGLQKPLDASVQRLEWRGPSLDVSAGNATGQPRTLWLSGADAGGGGGPTTRLSPGRSIISAQIRPDARDATARVEGQDLWPENDTLRIRVPAPASAQRWFVGSATPDASWRAFAPENLPLDSAAYLAPAVIVLGNVPAGVLSEPQQRLLTQYVRDLGGGLVITGGDRAFAAGSYSGGALETLSPLASLPPKPTVHWIMLIDSSGSMSEPAGDLTRWDLEKRAILRLLPLLPPEDPLTIGSFARELRWWSIGKPAGQTAAMALPPADIGPLGPTNLQPALEGVIATADAALANQLLLITDAETELTDLARLRAGLAERKIRLNVLTIAPGKASAALRELAAGTGGQLMEQLDPVKWTSAADELFRSAADTHLHRQALTARFSGELANLGPRQVDLWNRTWLKKDAAALATAEASGEAIPLAGRWQFGTGKVFAAAFAPDPGTLAALASAAAQPPRDPRLRVTWQTGSTLRITVDAVDDRNLLNGLALTLHWLGDGQAVASQPPIPIPQVAPGRYELEVPPPRQPDFAAVRQGPAVVDQIALAGRYPAEFDAIGNDHASMDHLAASTGGAVIWPGRTKPIDMPWPTRPVPLTPALAIAGAALLALAAIRSRF